MQDFVTDMTWRRAEPDLDAWCRDFVRRRYGRTTPDVEAAWQLLRNTAYLQVGRADPVLVMRPSKASHQWGSGHTGYDPAELAQAAEVTITCGTNRLVGTNPQKIVRAARMSLKKKTNSSRTPPLWDGKAAQRMVSVLVKHLRALNKGTSVQARRKAKVPTAMAA